MRDSETVNDFDIRFGLMDAGLISVDRVLVLANLLVITNTNSSTGIHNCHVGLIVVFIVLAIGYVFR